MTAPLHVIVGAGQIGPLVADRLLARGLRVRIVRRTPSTRVGVETVAANLTDPAQAIEACRGAAVVYHLASPRYHRWTAELVPLARGIVAGATAAGARLVALDNLYMYELPLDGRLTPENRIAPRSRKGALRAEAAALMLAAPTPTALVRGADFIGPTVTQALLGERFWQKLFAGKPVEVLGDPNQPHSYTYAPDVADALVTVALAESDAYGRAWHVPTHSAESTRAWIERFARALGQPVRLARLSPTMLKVVGLFIREASEMPEMIYQWEQPFLLDDAAFRARFGAAPTPCDRIVAETTAWARQHYARAAA